MQKMKLNLQFFASGTINKTSSPSAGDVRIVWSSTKNDINNKSSVTATVQIKRSSSGTTTGTFSGTLVIDGTSYSISKYGSWSTSWVTVGSKTKEVTHNEDGSKSINISTTLTQTGTSMAGTYKASGSATLDKINRASKLSAIEDFKLTDTITINITKYITTAVDKLQIKLGDTLIREVANISNGYELTFTTTEQTTIKNLMTSPQATLIFLLTTISGETTLGTSTQSATVTSLDKPIYRNIIKKENGHYQVAINGVVNNEAGTFQVYDDDGNLINGDTGWINATLTSDFKLYDSSGYCRYRKIGKEVNIQFQLSPNKTSNNLNSATDTVVFTLPEEYRPTYNLIQLCQGSGTNIFITSITPNGKVAISRYRNSSSYSSSAPGTSTWLPCNITYFVD